MDNLKGYYKCAYNTAQQKHFQIKSYFYEHIFWNY